MNIAYPNRRAASRLILAATLLMLTACGGSDDAAQEGTAAETPVAEPATETTAAEAPAETTTPETEPVSTEPTGADTTEAAAGVTVATSESSLGEIIVDGEGAALYLLTADSADESVCSDECANAWPPLLSEAQPTAGEGVDEALLGTLERADGSTQVTYGDHPLYYFQGDTAAGDVNGQGIESFGGIWWVIAPSGDAITGEATNAASTDY